MVIHYEFESLVRWINDQGIPVEMLDDDHVFDAQIITWKALLFPSQSIAWDTQELNELDV